MYCESCLDAAYDEGAEDVDDAELLLAELGADIADHLCDNVEVGLEAECKCPCKTAGSL